MLVMANAFTLSQGLALMKLSIFLTKPMWRTPVDGYSVLIVRRSRKVVATRKVRGVGLSFLQVT